MLDFKPLLLIAFSSHGGHSATHTSSAELAAMFTHDLLGAWTIFNHLVAGSVIVKKCSVRLHFPFLGILWGLVRAARSICCGLPSTSLLVTFLHQLCFLGKWTLSCIFLFPLLVAGDWNQIPEKHQKECSHSSSHLSCLHHQLSRPPFLLLLLAWPLQWSFFAFPLISASSASSCAHHMLFVSSPTQSSQKLSWKPSHSQVCSFLLSKLTQLN